MTGLLNPGDAIEGQGFLLQHGHQVAAVDYHLFIPTQTHFFIKVTDNLKPRYEDHIAGFILVAPQDAEKVTLSQYTLQLANSTIINVQIERRYTDLEYQGKPRISFALRVASR